MNTLALQNPGIASRFLREVNAAAAIAARDITLFFKSPGMILMSLFMPVVMMGLLGGSLGQNMAGGLEFQYGKFMLVGMLVNTLFMTTTTGITSLVEDRFTDFTQEMMVSPVSRYSIVIGKILGSSFGAVVSMAGTLVVGFIMGITLTPAQMLTVLVLSPLMCLSAGAIAMLVIGLVRSNKMANMAVMLITMPQMFLSGAIIPMNHSSGVLLFISRLMPMTYCLDLTRAAVYAGSPEYGSVVLFNPAVTFTAILAITAVCLAIGTFFFAASEKHR